MGFGGFIPVAAGALAFFAVGVVWYGLVFAKAWRRAAGLAHAQTAGDNMLAIFVLTYLLELVVAAVLWHGLERSDPSNLGIMLMAVGFGTCVMAPAIGISYLYLRKPVSLFLIDAGHLAFGTAAMGGVFVLFR